MEKHIPAPSPATAPEAECQRVRWERSAFRLHTLAMNPDLASMGSPSTDESGEAELPVHWMLLDPVLAPIRCRHGAQLFQA